VEHWRTPPDASHNATNEDHKVCAYTANTNLIYTSDIAIQHGRTQTRCATTTVTMASPGLNPLVTADEATWYIEMSNASASRNQVRKAMPISFRLSQRGARARYLFGGRPSMPQAKDPGSICKWKCSTKAGAITRMSRYYFLIKIL
jgi:hypothetical protein